MSSSGGGGFVPARVSRVRESRSRGVRPTGSIGGPAADPGPEVEIESRREMERREREKREGSRSAEKSRLFARRAETLPERSSGQERRRAVGCVFVDVVTSVSRMARSHDRRELCVSCVCMCVRAGARRVRRKGRREEEMKEEGSGGGRGKGGGG